MNFNMLCSHAQCDTRVRRFPQGSPILGADVSPCCIRDGDEVALTVVGIAGGAYEWSFFKTPNESALANTYGGTIADLSEVVAMCCAVTLSATVTFAVERYRRNGQCRPEM
jgi:hypothetical protein